jgi:hypothetical protein
LLHIIIFKVYFLICIKIFIANPIYIFEIYSNDKKEEVYFMKSYSYYFKPGRKFCRFKTESGVEEGEVTINKTLVKE